MHDDPCVRKDKISDWLKMLCSLDSVTNRILRIAVTYLPDNANEIVYTYLS